MTDWKRLAREKLPNLSADPAREAEILQEIADHLEDRHRQALASGLAPGQARRQVLSELSDPAATQRFRQADRRPAVSPAPPPLEANLLESVVRDLGYAFRMLRRHPAFSLFAILVLGSGIAAAASVFAVVNAVLLRPLPYPEPERLILVGHGSTATRPGTLGFATLQDWEQQSRTLAGLAAVRSWAPTLQRESGAERLTGVRVGASYFSLLGVRPAIGRDFEPADDHPDSGSVVILSHALWRDRLGGDSGAVGRTLTLNGRGYQVIGVLPEGYRDVPSAHLYQEAEIWAPLAYDTSLPWACRSCQHLKALGRLRPEAVPDAAATELNAIHSRLKQQYPTDYAEEDRAAVATLHGDMSRPVRPALTILGAAVLLVLLISTANVANLLFARGMRRRKEVSLRLALGAGRRRLLRQVLTENALLGAAAGVLGLLLTLGIVRVLLALAPAELTRFGPLEMGWSLILLAPLAAALIAVAAGAAPAFGSTSGDMMASLRQDSRLTPAPGVQRAQKSLIVADLALAMVLLAGSLLMLQSVRNLIAVDPGFVADGLLSCQLSMVGESYSEDAAVTAVTGEVLTRVGAIPGVIRAAAASQIPQGGNWDSWGIHREDRPDINPAEAPSAQLYAVTPGYFETMGIPLERGRPFLPADRPGALPVAIVGSEAAARFWPGEDPLGKRVRVGGSEDGPWWTVVGLVSEVRHAGLDAPPGDQLYLPLLQRPHPYPTLVMKTGSPPAVLVGQIRRSVAEVRRDIPVYRFATMNQLLGAASADRRFVTLLLAGFVVVAVLLTAAGIYGLASFFVLQRTQELAVRMALGAGLAQVAALVLGRGARLTAVGIAAGLAFTAVLTRFMESLLFRIQPLDPLTLAACGALLALAVASAHFLPLRRALRIQPSRALRAE